MHWDRFCQILIETDEKFKQILLDLTQYQSFLKKSSLSISFESTQVPFKKELTVYDLKYMSKLLKDSDYKDNILRLHDLLKRLEDDQEVMVKQKRNEGMKEIVAKIGKVKDELNTFPLNELEVHDVDIQIIFPRIDIEAIQVIKSHALTNKDKVCYCRACISVFL